MATIDLAMYNVDSGLKGDLMQDRIMETIDIAKETR